MTLYRTVSSRLMVVLLCCLILLPITLLAGGGHGEDEEVSQVISTEGKTGVSLFLITMYNDHRLIFALMVTAVMAILGMTVASVTEVFLRAIGVRTGH